MSWFVGNDTSLEAHAEEGEVSDDVKQLMPRGLVLIVEGREVADNCIFGAQSGIANSIKKPGMYMGYPAIDAGIWRRAVVRFKQSGTRNN